MRHSTEKKVNVVLMNEFGVPKGIRVLCNVTQQPSDRLRGFSVSSKSDELGEQLGSGATGVVFRRVIADKERDGVVKESRYGLKSDVEHELSILKEHIPELIQLGDTNEITLAKKQAYT